MVRKRREGNEMPTFDLNMNLRGRAVDALAINA